MVFFPSFFTSRSTYCTTKIVVGRSVSSLFEESVGSLSLALALALSLSVYERKIGAEVCTDDGAIGHGTPRG